MLPDMLQPGLKLVICGTAAGEESARRGQYYAKPTNKFWSMLYQTDLTPRKLEPGEFRELLAYGIGLTDLVKNKAGMDRILGQTDFGSDILADLIRQYQPKYVCFNGKRAAEEFFQHAVDFGLQDTLIGQTKFFVAPSTSGAANGWWNLDTWKDLARLCTFSSEAPAADLPSI